MVPSYSEVTPESNQLQSFLISGFHVRLQTRLEVADEACARNRPTLLGIGYGKDAGNAQKAKNRRLLPKGEVRIEYTKRNEPLTR
jgi:hypothetical protein